MALESGHILDGKYRVVRPIGEGSMGAVYEGEHIRIGRRVAIKVIHAKTPRTPELIARFEREAQAAARVNSPHICGVLDLGDLPAGDRYIVMEYLEGTNLDQRLEARGRLGLHETVSIAYEILVGLTTLHEAGIVHRDLKPANVFLAKFGEEGEIVKILDFGISKLRHAEDFGRMTATGTVVGTPLYMSPEQARGKRDVDGRADLYSLGVILYHALSGQLPFTGENFHELMFKIALEEPPPLAGLVPELDAAFIGIVSKAMAREVHERYSSAREFQHSVVQWARSQGRSNLALSMVTPEHDEAVAPTTPAPQRDAGLGQEGGTGPKVKGTPVAWSGGAHPPRPKEAAPKAPETPRGNWTERMKKTRSRAVLGGVATLGLLAGLTLYLHPGGDPEPDSAASPGAASAETPAMQRPVEVRAGQAVLGQALPSDRGSQTRSVAPNEVLIEPRLDASLAQKPEPQKPEPQKPEPQKLQRPLRLNDPPLRKPPVNATPEAPPSAGVASPAPPDAGMPEPQADKPTLRRRKFRTSLD